MAPLAIENYVVRSTPGANPAKRRLGHTAWFFETFVLSREGVPGRYGTGYSPLRPEYQEEFPTRVGRATGPGSRLLLGVDRKKDKGVLDRAYDDPEGLNAAFNRNILNNVNALADGDFNPETWIHRAFYDEGRGRIELWLVSAVDQTVRVAGETLRFAAGDRIHTENSYKYEIEEVLELAAPAWRPLHHWSDPGERFSVFPFGR